MRKEEMKKSTNMLRRIVKELFFHFPKEDPGVLLSIEGTLAVGFLLH